MGVVGRVHDYLRMNITRRLVTQAALASLCASALGTADAGSTPKSTFGATSTGEDVTAGLDLTVVACANEIDRMARPIDILICNAGIVLSKLEQVHGLEKQFVVNH